MAVHVNAFDKQEHLQVVDALRGYAILLVIAVHSVGYVRELAWPVKRFLSLGFYGVQLFFIASAVTLLMSWHRSGGSFAQRSAKFLIRRFFRIAPFYYLAIVIYWFAYDLNASDFSLQLLLATVFFVNAWSPYLIPTVPGWTPVPGGWSIGVEFCFYFIFPLLTVLITDVRRSVAFFGVALLVLAACSRYGQGLYPEIDQEARWNFLYFWPPNHLAVFSLGFLLYHLVKDDRIRTRIVQSRVTANHVSAALLLVLAALSFYGVRKFFDVASGLPPTHLLLSVCFVPWALVLILKPHGYAINPAITGLGKVSFSAYVLHFAVLRYTDRLFGAWWPFGADGVASIAYELCFLSLAVLITRLVAELSYRIIEQPFVRLGKNLSRTLERNYYLERVKR